MLRKCEFSHLLTFVVSASSKWQSSPRALTMRHFESKRCKKNIGSQKFEDFLNNLDDVLKLEEHIQFEKLYQLSVGP